LLAEAAADFEPQSAAAGRLQVDPAVPWSAPDMDRALVLRALGNLPSNAIAPQAVFSRRCMAGERLGAGRSGPA
jgi:hypothetical protein